MSFNEKVGLLRRGWIHATGPKGKIFVKLNNAPLSSNNPSVTVDAPYSMFYNNGLFVGALPDPGTPVIVAQGSGGEYYFVSYLAEDVKRVPTLTPGELRISSNNRTKITLNTSNNINIGSDGNNIHINTTQNYMSRNFNNDYKFTQAGRRVEGIVKRDLIRNTNYDQKSKLESNDYESEYHTISMDPTVSPSPLIAGTSKNPPFVEHRETVYEFQYQSDITDDLNESTIYSGTGSKKQNYNYPNRRVSRSDTLSLSLVSPNYLMESIKGTVVDIFGNILDLNRVPLPIGKDQNTIQSDGSTDKVKSFLNIKALQRKSLAYHFEINARKDLSGKNGETVLPDVTSNKDYARNRSRFFIDIDKEGQFKLNVPASSETGNIPLLTRYENYSTYGTEDDGNPNKLVQLKNNQDIFHDCFAAPALKAVPSGFLPVHKDGRKGSISIESDKSNAAPKDRITDQHINHGMVYHDILQTCFIHQHKSYLNYQAGEIIPHTIDLSRIKDLTDIVSTTILTSGAKANGGGRSGSINLDGSLEINIGANTVDRQSLWFDTAGGIVTNIGRDRNGRSLIAATGGDVYFQVGGFGVSADSRFPDVADNKIQPGVLDLRITGSGGFCHMIRVDDDGVTILTPGQLKIHSKKDMLLTSDKNIRIECTTLILQERMHLKNFGGSS